MIKEDDQIARWASFVKSNNEWKKWHTMFIDSQLENRIRVIKDLLRQRGAEKR